MDSKLHDCLSYLEEIEIRCYRKEIPLDVHIKTLTLRMEASFLESILNCSRKWQTENGYLEVLFARAQMRFRDAIGYLHHLIWSESKGRFFFPEDMDKRLSSVLKKLQLIKMEVRKAYNVLTDPWRSMVVITDEAHITEFLEALLKNTSDLLEFHALSDLPVADELEAVDKGLTFLRCFLGFTAKGRGTELEEQTDLLTHVAVAAFKFACLLYLRSFPGNKTDGDEMKHEAEVQIQNIIMPVQPATRDIYIKALKPLPESAETGTPTVDKFAWGFLDSLVDNMMELSGGMLGFITSVKDQILALHQELKLLRYYINVCDRQFHDLCKHAISIITETGCVIFSLNDADNNEDMTGKLKAALSNLLAKFGDINADAKLIRMPLKRPDLMIGLFEERLREKSWKFGSPTNGQTLGPMICFLESVINWSGKWQIENQDLKALLAHVQTQYQDVIRAYQLFCLDYVETRRVSDVDLLLFFVLRKLELIKLDLREVYNILAPLRSLVVITDEARVMEILESLLKNTKALLNCQAYTILPVKNELEDVEKSLGFFRLFLGFFSKRGGYELEQQKDLLGLAEAVAFNIACLLYLCSANKIDGHNEQDMKLELEVQLQKIQPVQSQARKIYIKALKAVVESPQEDTPTVDEFSLHFLDWLLQNLIELSKKELDFITSVKDQILALHGELAWLRYYITDPLCKDSEHIVDDQQLTDLCKHANSLTTATAYAFFMIYDADENEDMARESKAVLSNLLASVEDAKADARKTFDKLVPKQLWSNFPRTNFQGFISSLLQNLEDLVNYTEGDTIAIVKHDVEAVRKALLHVRDDFSKIAKVPRDQWMRFNDVAHQAEYVIDLLLARGCPLFNFKFAMSNIMEEIMMIKRELQKLESKTTDDDPLVQQVGNLPSQVSSEPDSLPNDVFISSSNEAADGMKKPTPEVTFPNEADKILDQLNSDDTELQIISIVGLPGIGKTTLADSLYVHPSVTSCFHVRARICVSKAYRRRKLLLNILQGVIGEIENFDKKDDEELEEVLYKKLKFQRYLIFMDDVWNIKPWLAIKAFLPDDRNGSRIMFTSRFHSIALQAKMNSVSYQLDLLSDEKCWEMLYSKLFQKEERCPTELVEAGKEIAKSCRGLPLTIDLIAGVLRIKERKKHQWQQVARTIKKEIADDPQQRCQKVLEQSYSDLPDHLKPCFLYFGAFPEDTEVPAKRLIWLWIAEGFIQLQKVDQSIEKEAESYLDDLVARSLVTVSKRRSCGGMKANGIHDLLRDFASEKAKEEFFLLHKGTSNLSSSSSYDYTNEAYRLVCDSDNWGQFNGSRPFGSRVRSILLLHHIGSYESQFLKFIFVGFRLLRVLDLQGIKEEKLDPNPVSFMVHLKFIALSALQDWILSLLPRFQKLETILLVGSGSRIFSLDSIWKLLRLRHFHVGYCLLELPRVYVLTESHLANLLSLSTPCLRHGAEAERMMRRLPNLQRLSCTVKDSWDFKKKCNLFPRLDFLKQLYSLKMIYVGKVLHPVDEFSFPPYLKKLTLSEFRLPWSEISTIAKLEQLEVLKLRIRAFEGEIWQMRDGEFPRLKVLSLCKLDIEQWNAEEVEDELPPLERLEVLDCKNLVELPFCLANVPTLKVIRLWKCNSSLENSAKKIVQEQKANENDELEINRDPPAKTGWKDRMEFLSLSS